MNSRTALILTVVVFIASPVLAWLIHAGVIDIGLDINEGKNFGELVHPARPLEGFALQNDNGDKVDLKDFEGKWSMLQFADNPCIDSCQHNFYKMRQIRLAIGKDAYRVQRVVVAEKATDLTELLEHNPGTSIYRITGQSKPMLEKFPGYIAGDISPISGRIYIIDPLGNLMMKYAEEVNPSDVLNDLRQLLKATWIRPTNQS